MTLLEIAQKKNCGGDAQVNTGKLGCLVELATPENLIRMSKSVVIPKETEFTLDFIKQKIIDGVFTPIIGASAFEDISAEDSYNTNSSGEKRLNLKGLIEHRYTFEEGHEFYKQMSKLESFKSDAFLIGDDEGNWAMAVNSNGDYVGFTAGHVTPEKRMSKVKGGDNEMKPLVIQFTDRKQYDENYDVFLYENLGFTPEEVPSVNGVNLSFTSAPAALSTDFSVKAVLASDNNTAAEGMNLANFDVKVNGVSASIASVTESAVPGVYDITMDVAVAASDVVTVGTAGVVGITDVDSVLLRANVLAEATA